MRVLENKSVEHFFAVHINAKGEPFIQFLGVSSRIGVMVDPRDIVAGAKRHKAVKTIFTHNHPTANLTPSRQDIELTNKLREGLGALGIEIEHIIMDTYKGKYAVIEEGSGIGLTFTRENQKEESKWTAEHFDEMEVLTKPMGSIRSSADAVRIIQQTRFSALPKRAVLVLNAKNEVIGNYIIRDYMDAAEVAASIPTAIGVIFYGNEGAFIETAGAKKALSKLDIRVLDYITTNSDGKDIHEAYTSAAEEGVLGEVQGKYCTNSIKTGKAESDLKIAEKNLATAKRKLSDAQDKIAKNDAKQGDMFSRGAQGALFGIDKTERNTILDPLKADVRKAGAEVERLQAIADNERNTLPGQMSLFDRGIPDKYPPAKKKVIGRIIKAMKNVLPNLEGVHVLKGNDFLKAAREARDGRFNFIGEKAAFEKAKNSLEKAKKLFSENTDGEIIFEKTGWYKDANDGKWKYEFPNNAKLLPIEIKSGADKLVALDKVLDFPELYEAYPEARNIKVLYTDLGKSGLSGGFNEKTNTIYLDNGKTINPQSFESGQTLVHELQHFIQEKEGFAKGASISKGRERVASEIRRLGAQAEQIRRILAAQNAPQHATAPLREDLRNVLSQIKDLKENSESYTHYYYRGYVGEIEARNAEHRMDDGLRRMGSPNRTTDKYKSEDKTVSFMRKSNGTIYGFVQDGHIYLNGDKLNANTPIHEGGHLFMQWAKENAPELHREGLDKMDGTQYLKDVQADSFYVKQAKQMHKGGASEAEIQDFYRDEALARAIGDSGQKMSAGMRNQFRQWLDSFWNAVKEAFGKGSPAFEKMSAKKIRDMSLADFGDAVAGRLLSGKKLEGNGNTITPEMRTEVAEGQPLFMSGSNFEENPLTLYDEKGRINKDELKRGTDAIERGTARIDRLSLAEEQGRTRGARANVEASLLLRGGEKTGRTEIRAERTEQEQTLKEYAEEKGIWVNPETIEQWEHLDDGMESRVYYGGDHVKKVGYNYLNFYDTPRDFLDNKISLHNFLFTDTPLELTGFTQTHGADGKGEFFAPVYKQPFVQGEALQKDEQHLVDTEMEKRGFKRVGKNDYVSKDYVIKDLHPENIIVTPEGNYRFIDTAPMLNTPENGFGGTREYGSGDVVSTGKGSFNAISETAKEIVQVHLDQGVTTLPEILKAEARDLGLKDVSEIPQRYRAVIEDAYEELKGGGEQVAIGKEQGAMGKEQEGGTLFRKKTTGTNTPNIKIATTLEEARKKPVSVRDIAKFINEVFGVPVHRKHIGNANAAGICCELLSKIVIA